MQEQTLSDKGGERLNSGAVTSQINGVGGGRFIVSAPRSEYFRFDHSFIPGERVRGSFVRFDKMGTGIKVYALFDLEDGRKTRVDVKYLNFLNGREAMLMPGDKVTMTANDYATRLNQPSWKIESTPRRFDQEGFTIKYPTPIQLLLMPKDDWVESDSDFENEAGVDGVISRFITLHHKRRFAIVDADNGAKTRVHRVSFEKSGLSIDDFKEGNHITLVKKGFMPDRHTTKWLVFKSPFQYDENGNFVSI